MGTSAVRSPDDVFPDELPAELIQQYRGLLAQQMRDWPEAIREPLIEFHLTSESLRVGLQEGSNVNQLDDEIRHTGRLPDIPLIVLCSMAIDGFKRAVLIGETETLLREELDGKRRLYTDFSGSIPSGEVRLVDAGHVTMHYRDPEAVLQAIGDLLPAHTTPLPRAPNSGHSRLAARPARP